MNMNNNSNIITTAPVTNRMMTMSSGGQMTFYWGQAASIFISGWPGESTTMYIIALITIFLISMLVEWLSHARIIKPGLNDVVAGLLQTLMYGTRIGLAYLVMLAVMSFNVGVFIAAISGYTTGFLLFGSLVLKKSLQVGDWSDQKSADLPPLTC